MIMQASSHPEEQRITTLDINLAAYLALHGISPSIEVEGTRALFTFPASDDYFRLSESYYQNEDVPVVDYVNALRRMKSAMYSALNRANGKDGYRRRGRYDKGRR